MWPPHIFMFLPPVPSGFLNQKKKKKISHNYFNSLVNNQETDSHIARDGDPRSAYQVGRAHRGNCCSLSTALFSVFSGGQDAVYMLCFCLQTPGMSQIQITAIH